MNELIAKRATSYVIHCAEIAIASNDSHPSLKGVIGEDTGYLQTQNK